MTVLLNGSDLSRKQVNDISVNHERVRIDTSKLAKGRKYIRDKVRDEKIIYGVTTGFGSNADKLISANEAVQLQINLLRSHACGVGPCFSEEVVRAIMTIRLNTLLKGYSGVQVDTVRRLQFFLNKGIHPAIPEQGSVGASGDLCPLSHMALPLIGEGEVLINGKPTTFDKRVQRKFPGYSPVKLSFKEGLALNNGTAVMTAVGVHALEKAYRLLHLATYTAALTFEALGARKNSFAYKSLHIERRHKGQQQVAGWLTQILRGSKLVNISQQHLLKKLIATNKLGQQDILDELKNVTGETDPEKQKQVSSRLMSKIRAATDKNSDAVASLVGFAKAKWKPQDSYSVRCVPQVFGATKAALDHVASILDGELNAAVDNPLIFADDNKVISGGNFHGQPIALVMDYLKIAVAEIGNIVERQINKLVDDATNDGLPGFLIEQAGLNSGLMIPQYVAAGLVSENKVLSHPASVDSIPTCANTEDHVSMGTIAARQAVQIAENVEGVIAIAALTSFYAVTLRLEQLRILGKDYSSEKNMLAPETHRFYQAIKRSNRAFQSRKFVTSDRFLYPEINAVSQGLESFEVALGG